MSVLDSRSFKIGEGISLERFFAIYENQNTGLQILVFDDRGEAPSGAEWSALDLVGNYTIEHEQFEEDLATSPKVGTFSIVAGSPDKVRFRLTDTETSDRTTYYGRVILREVADPDISIDALSYSLQIIDAIEVDIIPMNRANVLEALELTINDVSLTKVQRAMLRANNKALAKISPAVAVWCTANGWPAHLVAEVEELASLLLRKDIFDDDTTVNEEISDQLGIIGGISVSTGEEDDLPNIGGFNSIQLTRSK